MTADVLETTEVAAAARLRRTRRRRGQQGWLYASPTAIFVLVLFVAPLLLVAQMSASDWPRLAGNRGLNFPENFSKVIDNRFFMDSDGVSPVLVGVAVSSGFDRSAT